MWSFDGMHWLNLSLCAGVTCSSSLSSTMSTAASSSASSFPPALKTVNIEDKGNYAIVTLNRSEQQQQHLIARRRG